MLTRRHLLASAAVLAAAPHAEGSGSAVTGPLTAGPRRDTRSAAGPIAISSANGLKAVALAVERMRHGADGLDAAIAGVNLVEDDPADMTVGYGGIPNEDGVV